MKHLLPSRIRHKLNGWIVISGIGALAALLPSLYILTGLLRRPSENWAHIQEYMLFNYAWESLLLTGGTVAATVVAGTSLAWLTTAYDFPLRRFLSFAFVLPLAIPPYIAAYTYGSMLSYTGSVQTFMRNTLGWSVDQRYFNIMSMEGAIWIFSLFLFPYVYLITRTFLEKHSASFIENARLLGGHPVSNFFRIVLPLSQGAIAGGASLVAFEVLNDYGVSKHFGISTFTAAIFKTWFGMYDVDSAIRLSGLLMSFIIGLFIAERWMRRRRRYHLPVNRSTPLRRMRLGRVSGGIAATVGIIITLLSFFIPVAQLAVWAVWTYDDVWNDRFFRMIGNTLGVSAAAAALLMVLAVIAANASRTWRSGITLVSSKLLSMGYSIPGAVLSIGVLAVFISLDKRLAGVYEAMGFGANKLVLSMSLIMLVFAYIIRFLAVGFNAVDAGYDRIGERYSEASRMLGHGVTATFFKVELPLIKGAVLTGGILAFLEIVKELPLTLLLRPFNFDTLATKAYQYASDEQIHQAAIPSLIIILLGVIAVCIYQWMGRRGST
ncbi:iron ABC transporter permease [Paenibacillus pinisoli]|uniref:Iron ABC transporter permease n=1 Tax=Paenibacillus pinisoli TaxID=1276110 RepID=A0A3A6PMM6_9BACL|nr:iron ABC transporter permease [Paenibacillus pinisoli]RJX41630.1 iron ABC transporter permease [Paenibacillus pinisoli]